MENEEKDLDGLISFDIAGPPIVEERTIEEKAAETNETNVSVEDEDPEFEDSNEAINVEAQDEQAAAAFTLFKEYGVFTDEDIPEKQTIETFKETFSSLNEKLTERVIESSPQQFQDVLLYAHSKLNATREDLIKFLKLEESAVDIPHVETAEEAEEFLKKELAEHRLYKNAPASLQLYLDGLEDDQKLSIAKSIVKEKEDEVSKEKKAAIDAARYEKEQAQKQQQEYLQSITSAIEQSGWDKKKQEAVHKTLQSIPQINKVIVENPTLYAEYLNFLSTLDMDKKQFDTSKFALRKATEANKAIKDNIVADGLSSVLSRLSSGKNSATSSAKRDSLQPI